MLEPNSFKKYRSTNLLEMRPWVPGDTGLECMHRDTDGGPVVPSDGDMIHRGRLGLWLIPAWYLADNFEPVPAAPSRLSFGAALRLLKRGIKVERAGWDGKGRWLELQPPDEHSALPHIYLCTAADTRSTYELPQVDALAEDWQTRSTEDG